MKKKDQQTKYEVNAMYLLSILLSIIMISQKGLTQDKEKIYTSYYYSAPIMSTWGNSGYWFYITPKEN
jgi:hypothetical protein